MDLQFKKCIVIIPNLLNFKKNINILEGEFLDAKIDFEEIIFSYIY